MCRRWLSVGREGESEGGREKQRDREKGKRKEGRREKVLLFKVGMLGLASFPFRLTKALSSCLALT